MCNHFLITKAAVFALDSGSSEISFPGGIIQWARYVKNGTGLKPKERIYSNFLHSVSVLLLYAVYYWVGLPSPVLSTPIVHIIPWRSVGMFVGDRITIIMLQLEEKFFKKNWVLLWLFRGSRMPVTHFAGVPTPPYSWGKKTLLVFIVRLSLFCSSIFFPGCIKLMQKLQLNSGWCVCVNHLLCMSSNPEAIIAT